MKKYFSLICLLFFSFSLHAAVFYVSKETGKNSNEGTKNMPFKNLQKALNVAAAGDTIYVAQGNYTGIRDIGFLEMKEPVKIYGGYSNDFSKRAISKYQTKVIPLNEANPTSSSKPLFFLNLTDKKGSVVIDGLIFDKGPSNNYHASEGKPKGVATGYLTFPPAKGAKANITSNNPIIKGIAAGDTVIQNCLFNNAAWYAIQVGLERGVSMSILNNVFTSSVVAAIEVWGRGAGNDSNLEVGHNTFLFMWPTSKTSDSIAEAVRCMTRCHINIHHNIIGCAVGGGIGKTRIDGSKTLESSRKTKIDHNRFFLNKKGDLVLPSGGGLFERIFADEFEDLEFDSCVGNAELKEIAQFKNVLNKAYLEGFLLLTYSEKVDYDPHSAANQVRAALGMPQVAKGSSSVSMFGNEYPFEDSIKLFGVVKGFGAQLPQ